MMEEVSVATARDGHVVDQMSEEEILAYLVAETGPQFTVPMEEAKLNRLKIMDGEDDDDDDDDEDPLAKYLKENHRLQEAGLRLEQENDCLAHRLISSKVALRRALDKAEDRVDELSKDLLLTRRRLQATEEANGGKEEEAATLREVFRRELEKAEAEVRRSSVISADYKQICSQLTNRLDRQQAAHREEVDSLKSAMSVCPRCRGGAGDSDGPPSAPLDSAMTDVHGETEPSRSDVGPERAERRRDDGEKESLRTQIRELEQELAQTKLQMVEAKCKIQELEHQRGLLANDLQEAKNSWISKAFTSLRTPSGGGPHGIGVPKEGAPALGWNLHGGPLSGWSAKKLSWPHRDNRENV